MRYERLKEEFIKLIEKLNTGGTGQPLSTASRTASKKADDEKDRRIKELEETLEEERHDIQKKVKLYKD